MICHWSKTTTATVGLIWLTLPFAKTNGSICWEMLSLWVPLPNPLSWHPGYSMRWVGRTSSRFIYGNIVFFLRSGGLVRLWREEERVLWAEWFSKSSRKIHACLRAGSFAFAAHQDAAIAVSFLGQTNLSLRGWTRILPNWRGFRWMPFLVTYGEISQPCRLKKCLSCFWGLAFKMLEERYKVKYKKS